jgi:hypothetical protein
MTSRSKQTPNTHWLGVNIFVFLWFFLSEICDEKTKQLEIALFVLSIYRHDLSSHTHSLNSVFKKMMLSLRKKNKYHHIKIENWTIPLSVQGVMSLVLNMCRSNNCKIDYSLLIPTR